MEKGDIKGLDSIEESDVRMYGGSGDVSGKIRYYIVLPLFGKKPLGEPEVKRFYEEVLVLADKFDVVIEDVTGEPRYILFTVHIGVDVEPAIFIEECIKNTNKEGKLFNKEYLITNNSRPKWNEVQSFLKKIKK